MQDDTFNAKFNGVPMDTAAVAFIHNDNFGEWIGGKYYDLSQATAAQKADPNINGYALYTQLNSNNNGGVGALMPATGYNLEQYAVLARNDYNSGQPQSQALDMAIYQAQQQSGKDFLDFQGKIIGNAAVAALTAGIGNVAAEYYEGTRVGSVLEYALTTRTGAALTSTGVNVTAQAVRNGKVNLAEAATAGTSAYLGMGRGIWWNTALGAGTGFVNTEYANWSQGTDGNVWLNATTNGLVTGLGYGTGELTTGVLSKGNRGALGPVVAGNVAGSLTTEVANGMVGKGKDVKVITNDNRGGK